MTVGDVIAALIQYASDWDGDDLLLHKSVYSIEVHENEDHEYEIRIYFVDGNTSDVVIDKLGKLIRRM